MRCPMTFFLRGNFPNRGRILPLSSSYTVRVDLNRIRVLLFEYEDIYH